MKVSFRAFVLSSMLVASLSPSIGGAQTPGTSITAAQIYHLLSSSKVCDHRSALAVVPLGSLCSDNESGWGWYSDASSSAFADVNQTSAYANMDGDPFNEYTAFSYAENFGQISLSGAPTSLDRFVFHFTQDQTLLGSGGDRGEYARWETDLTSGTSTASAGQVRYADGSADGLGLINTVQTAVGFDMTVAWDGSSSFDYAFRAFAGTVKDDSGGDYSSTDVLASVRDDLVGIDAETKDGTLLAAIAPGSGVSSINFDAPISAPEPASVLLTATGLASLAGLVRKTKPRDARAE